MKDVNIDLYTRLLLIHNKKLLLLVIGFLLLVVGLQGYLAITNGGWAHWLQAVAFSIWGLEIVFNYKGRSINQVFGKAYLRINAVGIEYKPKEWRREQRMEWKDMKYIRFSSTMLVFHSSTHSVIELELGTLSYKSVIELKELVREKAKMYGINIGR